MCAMNLNFIENLKKHPFEKLETKEYIGTYFVKESFVDKGYRVDGEIRCGIHDNEFRYGSVEVYIDFEKFKTNHHAGFGELYVPSEICNHGIGKTLMLQMIETIRVYKKYYSIEETIEVCGWLSTSDKQNGNWNKSVPLYEKVGKIDKIECYFSVGDDEQHYTAEEFLEKATVDGQVHYFI